MSAALAPDQQASSSARKIGVLLVDDDPIVLMDMAQSLTDAGLVVFEARNADEALKVLATEPDVLMTITDVDMRDGSLDGFQLARLIAMRWPEIGLLIISGQNRPRASDLPEGERPRYQYRRTANPRFAAWIAGRENRTPPFFTVPAGGADICNAMPPVRRRPAP